MSKAFKISLIVAAALLVVGGGLAAGGCALGGLASIGWGERGLQVYAAGDPGEQVLVSETYANVDELELNLNAIARVEVVKGDTFSLEGMNYANRGGLTVHMQGGTLRVSTDDVRWNNFLDFGFGDLGWDETYVRVTVPANAELDDIRLRLNACTVSIEDVASAAATINTNACTIDSRDWVCDGLLIDANAGTFDLAGTFTGNTVITGNAITVDLSVGLPLEQCDVIIQGAATSASINGRSIDGVALDYNQSATGTAKAKVKVQTSASTIDMVFE